MSLLKRLKRRHSQWDKSLSMCLRHRILTPLGSAPAYLSATQVQGSLIFTYCSTHMTLCTPDSFHILSPPLSACSFWLSRALALVSNKSKLPFKTFFYFYDSSKNSVWGGHASSAILLEQDCFASIPVFPLSLILSVPPKLPYCPQWRQTHDPYALAAVTSTFYHILLFSLLFHDPQILKLRWPCR